MRLSRVLLTMIRGRVVLGQLGASLPAFSVTTATREPTLIGGITITRLPASGATLPVLVAGDIDMATAAALAEALELARHDAREIPDVTEIVVDLRPVGFLGAAGLRVLGDARDRCLLDAVVLRVVADQYAVTRPLLLTGMDHFLGLRPDSDTSAARPN